MATRGDEKIHIEYNPQTGESYIHRTREKEKSNIIEAATSAVQVMRKEHLEKLNIVELQQKEQQEAPELNGNNAKHAVIDDNLEPDDNIKPNDNN